MTEKNVGTILRGVPEFSSHAHGRDLNDNALFDECGDDRRIALDLGVAFGVDQNGLNALAQQPVKEFVGRRRNSNVGKLDEHVIASINSGHPISFGLRDDLVGNADFISRQNLQPSPARFADDFIKFGNTIMDFCRLGIVRKTVEHVRRGNDLFNTVVDRDPDHLECLIEAPRAVVDRGHDVRMYVNHGPTVTCGHDCVFDKEVPMLGSFSEDGS